METKQTAVQWLYDNVIFNPVNKQDIEYNEETLVRATIRDKEQMIKFGDKVLENSAGDYDGDIVLLKTMEEIYDNFFNPVNK
jgi:hypothetical protein